MRCEIGLVNVQYVILECIFPRSCDESMCPPGHTFLSIEKATAICRCHWCSSHMPSLGVWLMSFYHNFPEQTYMDMALARHVAVGGVVRGRGDASFCNSYADSSSSLPAFSS